MSKRSKDKAKRKRYPPPPLSFHECASEGCTRQVPVTFKFCRRCAGKTPRPNVDALSRRLPGSYGTGKGS